MCLMNEIDKIKQDLELLDKEIETAEKEKNQLEGRIIQAKETLKNTYDIDTVEQGQKEIEILKKNVDDLKVKINTVYTKLKSEYLW